MKKTLTTIFIFIATGAVAQAQLADGASLDFEYQVAHFTNVGKNVPIDKAYDYQNRTYIQVPHEWRPNTYNATAGKVIGAYACHNNTLYEVPLLTSGPNYIADGTFQSLFLYQRDVIASATPDPFHKKTENPRGLLNGVTRLDYVGANALRIREGKDDCLKILGNFFRELATQKPTNLSVAVADPNKNTDYLRYEIQQAAAAATSGGHQQFAGIGIIQHNVNPIKPQQTTELQRWQIFHVPFYVNRGSLGPKGKKVVESLMSTLIDAEKIVIRPAADNEEIVGDFLQKQLSETEEEPAIKSPDDLIIDRGSAIISTLLSRGISGQIISVESDDANSKNALIHFATDTIIEVFSRRQLVDNAPPLPSGQTGTFVGERHRHPQKPPAQIHPIVFVSSESPSSKLSPPAKFKPESPTVSVATTPLIDQIDVAAELNTFRARKGELISNAIARYLKKNGRQMIWQVRGNVDFRMSNDFEVDGPHLVATLQNALAAFPIQAVLDSNGGHAVVIVRRETRSSEAKNIIPMEVK